MAERPIPRITLTREESAESLGLSLSSFERHVQPFVPCIRRGKLRLFRIVDLERWAEQNAERVLAHEQVTA